MNSFIKYWKSWVADLKEQPAFKKQLHIVNSILENENISTFGLERTVRIFMSASQLFTPVMLIKVYFGRHGFLKKKIAVEYYLLFKIFFPLSCIMFEWFNIFSLVLNITMLAETLLYLGNLVLLSDVAKPHSYRRALLFTFLNYIEICFGFAALYGHLNMHGDFNTVHPFQTKMETIYFSFVTSSSIGYGDYVPNTGIAEFLVICQSLIFFLFIAIFMGFFVSKL
ncbi:MAG: potassium channel family protein [Saprospiraceae bacterium]